ncbi:hypothetical protein J2T09_002374 [Neorhizobium huautlense]|uniref:Uncharacterized protein n=1 Tax=Neorhizobium huautlense TaxID=67774 RepID=A0ABT9PT38_9HYPH|nr:hypothetical protein [Neorhizobium huautlense]
MAASFNRGRINCAPLTISPIARSHMMGLPPNLEAVASIYDYFPVVSMGLMVRVKSTGILCQWRGRALKNLDQRKATAALNLMQSRIDENYDWSQRKGNQQPDGSGRARDEGSAAIT